MCLVCRDWELGKLTTKEALRNLNEIIDLDDPSDEQTHYQAIEGYLSEKEQKDE